jgi:hypothetical protein
MYQFRNYNIEGERPLVFIMTDSTSSDASIYKLFPQSLLSEVEAQHIT